MYTDEKINDIQHMEEEEVFRLYSERRDTGLRNAIFFRYQYLAEILSKKYLNRGVDYEDLFQIASIGLINAIERFDVSKGYRFSSFATPTIIGEIKKYFRDKEWMIRVPRRLQKLSRRIKEAKQELAQELNRHPRVPELAEYLNVSEELVLEAMEAGDMYSPQSLDEVHNKNQEDREMTLKDLIGVEDINLASTENKDYIEKCIEKLNPKELKVLKDRYFRQKTQSQVARDLKVSQMTVSRIEKKIIEKFRRELNI